MRRVVGGLYGRVVLLIGQRELRIVSSAQRAIDGLVRRVGKRLCIRLAADEHLVQYLACQTGNNLLQDLLLRVDEVRLDLRTVAERHVAYQVELIAVGIRTLGDVYQRGILGVLRHVARRVHLTDARLCQSCLIHRVSDGTDAGHGLHLHVLHLTDIKVGISTHHRGVTAGADGVREHHRM